MYVRGKFLQELFSGDGRRPTALQKFGTHMRSYQFDGDLIVCATGDYNVGMLFRLMGIQDLADEILTGEM